MALHTLNVLPSELHPVLRMYWREHFESTMTLHHHNAPKEVLRCMRPLTGPWIWFHDLLPLATISGAIVATAPGTTMLGMVMVPAFQSAQGEYYTRGTSGVGTSQVGEAMTLKLSVLQLAS